MTAKEYLLQVSEAKKQLEQKKEEYRVLKAAAIMSGAADGEPVQTSTSGDRLEQAVIKYTDLETEIIEDSVALVRMIQRLGQMIDLLDNPLHRSILRDRYLYGKSCSQIAYEHAYGWKYVINQHGRALSEFHALYHCEYENLSKKMVNSKRCGLNVD